MSLSGEAQGSPATAVSRKLLIWGASGHASVVADVVRCRGQYEIVGFLDDVSPECAGSRFCDAPILGGRERLDSLLQEGIEHLILGFGNCEARLRLAECATEKGFGLATAIHPKATVASDVEVGDGTLIVAGAVVNPGAEVGNNVIVNTSASVDHDCVIEDGAHICPGACLAGDVHVGRGAWVGVGATAVDGVCIGEGTTVGAGSVVVGDLPAGVVAYGVPARIIREVETRD